MGMRKDIYAPDYVHRPKLPPKFYQRTGWAAQPGTFGRAARNPRRSGIERKAQTTATDPSPYASRRVRLRCLGVVGLGCLVMQLFAVLPYGYCDYDCIHWATVSDSIAELESRGEIPRGLREHTIFVFAREFGC